MERRDLSQVVTYAQGGGDPRWLGAIGHVSGLKYSFSYPGGPDQMSCLLQVPPTFRTEALSPGRIVKIFRGTGVVWNGLMDEPSPGADGWQCSAHGSGTFGTQFCDIYTTWSNPDDHINQAIARGLNWRNPGISGVSGLWLGDQSDSGSQMISDFLAGITVQGALGWSIGRRNNTLSIAPLPAAVNRLLVCTIPVARTVAADINSLFLHYQITSDTSASATAATYGTVNVTNAADIAAHGTTEDFYDLSGNGVMTSGAVAANGNAVLKRFNRANFSGPFTVAPGQLLNTGGVPVDLGAEAAGSVCRLILTDAGYGGEVTAAPVTFTVGEYEFDDAAQTATVTPMQKVASSFSDLLAAVFPAVSATSSGTTTTGGGGLLPD